MILDVRMEFHAASHTLHLISLNQSANILPKTSVLSCCRPLSLSHSSPAELSWEQSLCWHHINTVQSSCHSLRLQKRLIRQNVWQEKNMLPSCTPTSLHFPIPLVIRRHADIASSVFEERQQRPVWPVRVNQTAQEPGSSVVSICWDSSRVLWKRLFHLAVDRFINNTAVHCRDLDSVSNRALQPMIIIIHWQAYGSVILFSHVRKQSKKRD